MKIKCLLVDDEPLAIEVIESYIKKIDGFSILGKCSDAISAYNFLQKNDIDLIFLDIQMPELNGLDFLRSLQNPPKVILTTAHREFALEGFDLDVVDYLLKPISFTRFIQAVEKFSIIQNKKEMIKNSFSDEDDDKYIFVKADKKIHKIILGDILFIESMKDYLTIYSEDNRITTKMKISDMEKDLPKDKFLRIHKSFIVNKEKISSFTSYSMQIGKKELTIGRTYKEEVFKALDYKS